MNARLLSLIFVSGSLALAACALESEEAGVPEQENYLSSTSRTDASTPNPDTAKSATLDAAVEVDSSVAEPDVVQSADASGGGDTSTAVDATGAL